jgi:hypothetical protein
MLLRRMKDALVSFRWIVSGTMASITEAKVPLRAIGSPSLSAVSGLSDEEFEGLRPPLEPASTELFRVENGSVVVHIEEVAAWTDLDAMVGVGGRLCLGVVDITSEDPGMYDSGRLKYGVSTEFPKGEFVLAGSEFLFSTVAVDASRIWERTVPV